MLKLKGVERSGGGGGGGGERGGAGREAGGGFVELLNLQSVRKACVVPAAPGFFKETASGEQLAGSRGTKCRSARRLESSFTEEE